MKLASSLLTVGLVASLGVACGGDDSGATADAPSATLPNCTGGSNAFDTYGGSAFLAVNTAIINNTLAEFGSGGSGEANLGSAFEHIGDSALGTDYADSATVFTGRLAAFLVFAYGGPETTTVGGVSYDGKIDMKTAHAGMAITSAQFDYFVSNDVVPALTTSGVTTADVSACFAPVITSASFKASIVGQ